MSLSGKMEFRLEDTLVRLDSMSLDL
jgi:hypothetical protein